MNHYAFSNQFLPSTLLVTNIAQDVSPTTLSKVAGASIIVAIIVKIGKAEVEYPIIEMINISDIVPPPIGTAVTNNVASRATPSTSNTLPTVFKLVPKVILKTLS